MSKVWTNLSILLLGAAVFISATAIVLRRNEAGMIVGYRVDGYPCAVNVVSSASQDLIHTIFHRRPFCPADVMLSPDGHYVAIVDFPTGTVHIEPTHGDLQVTSRTEVKGATARYRMVSWSPDSRRLAFLADNERVTVLGISSVEDEDDSVNNSHFFFVPNTQPVPYSPLAWSPDGESLAIAAYSAPRGQGRQELFILNLQTGAVRRLTDNQYRDDSPAWSPDGTQLVFTSAEDGYNELHLMDIASGERRQLTHSTFGYLPVWSADDAFISFYSNIDIGSDLYIIGRDGTSLQRLTFEHYANTLYPVWLW